MIYKKYLMNKFSKIIITIKVLFKSNNNHNLI
jgi:hypothetical protein